MPIPEEPTNESQRDLRDGLSNPETEPLTSPPFPIFTYPPLPDTAVSELDGEADETGRTCADIEVAILTDLVNKLASVESVGNAAKANILGQVGITLSSIEGMSAKCEKKIRNDIINTMGNAYGMSASLGFNIPTPDRIAYGNATGDYIGAMDDRFVPPDSNNMDIPGDRPTSTGVGTGIPIQPSDPFPDDTPTDAKAGPVPHGRPGCGPFGWVNLNPGWWVSLPACATGGFMDWPAPGDGPYDPSNNYGGVYCTPTIRYNASVANPLSCPLSAFCPGFEGYRPGTFPSGSASSYKCVEFPSCHLNPNAFGNWTKINILEGYDLYIDLQFGILWQVRGAPPSHFHRLQTRPCATTPTPPTQPPPQPLPIPQPPTCIPICQPQCPPVEPGKPGEPQPGEEICEADFNNWCEEPAEPKPLPKAEEKDEYCDMLNKYVESINTDTPGVSTYLGMRKPKTKAGGVIADGIRNALGLPGAIFPETVGRFKRWLARMATQAAEGLACERDKMIPISLMLAALRFIQRWTDAIPKQTIVTGEQASNYICQSLIPATGDANIAHLNGTLTKEEWECYVKANGHYAKPMEKIMRAGRKKPVAEEYIKLFRRDYLKKEEFEKLIKTAGVIEAEDRDFLLKVTEAWPTTSDAVRFMQRDTADEKNVDWTEVDKVFEQKYTGRVKRYMDAIGLTREIALDNWRAHFHLPSYTMATEMFHRLRPGVVDEKLALDEKKLTNLLIQDDWHPDWIPRMIAIAYKTVTRTDTLRAYSIHAITEDELHKRFMDLGYNRESADFYVNYYKKNREISDRRRSGYPTFRTLSNQYARCEISNQQFRDTIAKLALSPEQERFAVEAAVLSRQVRERQQTIRAVRRPFVRGIIDESEALALLQNSDLDAECVSNMVEVWKLDRLRQDKFETASTLCQMREYGIIDVATHVQALTRIGFDHESAIRMAELCGAQLSEKERRRAEATARRTAADIRRAQKEAEKLRRLQECGPPACPKNTPGGSQPLAGGPQTQGQT